MQFECGVDLLGIAIHELLLSTIARLVWKTVGKNFVIQSHLVFAKKMQVTRKREIIDEIKFAKACIRKVIKFDIKDNRKKKKIQRFFSDCYMHENISH